MKRVCLFLCFLATVGGSEVRAQNLDSIVNQAKAQYAGTTDSIFSPMKSNEVITSFQMGYLLEKQQFEQFVAAYFQQADESLEYDENQQVLSDDIADKAAQVPVKQFRFFDLPIVLSNGEQVILEFGRTNDLVSANQEVSYKLVQALREVLETANAALRRDSIPPITRLYIPATTNGKHSPTSNHARKEAVDISEVNGQRMIYSHLSSQQKMKLKDILKTLDYDTYFKGKSYLNIEGYPYSIDEIFLSDRIQYLQDAMLRHPFTRENFGPFLKTKYSKETGKLNPNHPVGGHKDHIHWSVR